MKITVSGEITEEELIILASKKGYQETIFWVTNDQKPKEYLEELYRWIIISDVANIYIWIAKEQRAESERLEEEAIRARVTASITSSIE